MMMMMMMARYGAGREDGGGGICSGVIRDILHGCDHAFFTFYTPLSRFTCKSNLIYTQKKRPSMAFPVTIFTTHKCSLQHRVEIL